MMETTTIFGVMLVLCGICVFYILILRSEENKVQETIKKQSGSLENRFAFLFITEFNSEQYPVRCTGHLLSR